MENKFREQLEKCQQELNTVTDLINLQHIQSQNIGCNNLYNALYKLIPLIPEDFLIFKNRLQNKILPILKINNFVMTNQSTTLQNGINPYALGEVIATINYLEDAYNNNLYSIWNTMHPQITFVAKDRFDNGHYADSVEAAFKEINTRIKNTYKDRTSIEDDGVRLMQVAFSPKKAIIRLGDSTITGNDIQQGYMEMFAGAIMGIRNPHAHNNQTLSKSDAVRKLNFASMLMDKLDNDII